jgi:hypothetical protein
MKAALLRVIAVVAVIALVATLAVGFVMNLTVVDPPVIAIVDGRQPINYCGRSVSDFYGVGQFNDPVAGDVRKVREAYTQTRIWTSWFQDGRSFPVTVEARIKACNTTLGMPSPPDRVYYRFLYMDSPTRTGWRGFSQGAQDSLGAGVYAGSLSLGAGDQNAPLGAFNFQIEGFEWKPCVFDDSAVKDNGRGPEGYDPTCTQTGATEEIVDGASLLVQVLVARVAAPGGLNNYQPMLIFQDEVELRSALPSVSWTEGGYATGETAVVEYEVPTTTYETCDTTGNCVSRPAYFLEVRDTNTNAPLAGFNRTPITGERSGNRQIPILPAYFSNDLATCQNRLRAILYSELIVVDQADASVQQAESAISIPAPVVTGITADKDEYFEGDQMVLTWTATGNVTRYHITVHIGGLLLIDQDTTTPNATVITPRTGIAEVEVTAYNRCQPSDVHREQWTVGAVFTGLCEQFPTASGCDEPGLDLLALLRIIGLAIALVLLLVFLLWAFGRVGLPPVVALLVPFLIVAVAAGLLFAGGFFALGLVHVLPLRRKAVRT